VRYLDEPLEGPTRAALRLLADRSRSGKILVTTTRRALDYCHMRRTVSVTARVDAGRRTIVEARAGGASTLDGLTVYCDGVGPVDLRVDGVSRPHVENAPDNTGRRSVSIPWRPLVFPA
jgi:hypothetical protein